MNEDPLKETAPSGRAPADGEAGATTAGGPMSASMRKVFLQLAAEDARYPDVTTVAVAEGRRIYAEKHARWNRIDCRRFAVERFSLRHREGTIPAARIRRIGQAGEETPANLLYIHGGGWTFGGIDSYLGIMSGLAERTGFAVYGIDYALAPEHPFPAGLDDCFRAWLGLRALDDADRPWFLAGDSSGANLALSLMLDLRQRGQSPPGAAALVYGAYCGEIGGESQRRYGQGEFGLTTARMAWFLDNYRAGGVPAGTRPRLFPIEAELRGLPPLLVIAAELDPLRDDSARLSEKLAQAGVPHEFRQFPGVIHNFLHMSEALPEAAAALDAIAAFLTGRLGPQAPG